MTAFSWKHLLAAILLLVCLGSASAAQFKIIFGSLVFMDSGRSTAIGMGAPQDVSISGGGEVRVFTSLTQGGLTELEIVAKTDASFWILGQNVTLHPRGRFQVSVPDRNNPSLNVTWTDGDVQESPVHENPKEIVAFFCGVAPPVFSKPPLPADFYKIKADPSPTPEESGTVDVEFFLDNRSDKKERAPMRLASSPTSGRSLGVEAMPQPPLPEESPPAAEGEDPSPKDSKPSANLATIFSRRSLGSSPSPSPEPTQALPKASPTPLRQPGSRPVILSESEQSAANPGKTPAASQRPSTLLDFSGSGARPTPAAAATPANSESNTGELQVLGLQQDFDGRPEPKRNLHILDHKQP
jgi:hypothetical protein